MLQYSQKKFVDYFYGKMPHLIYELLSVKITDILNNVRYLQKSS